MGNLHFMVDSRLASLLGQEYSSTERALKELIDNAWDADSGSVSIVLPEPMSDAPIVVSDDGHGMTEEELRRHYLYIASDRRVRRGERTAGKKRLIKGRKGIGKFAGFMVASEMTLETRARGTLCRFTLRLDDLQQVEDIEQLPLDLHVSECLESDHGTTITLSQLHQGYAYPDANKLRQLLLQEYGRSDDFSVSVNAKLLDIDDVAGEYQECSDRLPNAGDVRLRFSISESKTGLRQPGIVLKVDGKAVGKPQFFGLDQCEDFPPKLLKKLYGEIDADELRDHVTASWDSLVENSELLKEVETHVQPILFAAFNEQYRQKVQLAQARFSKTIHDRLAQLPEHKREYADKAIKKVLAKYYGEPESKVKTVVFVLLEALERSDYRILMEHIAESSRGDIASIADALNEFGLADMAYLVQQASARSVFLDQLEQISRNPDTLEIAMHKAIEKALWILGPEYALFTSNITLKRVVEDFLGKKYSGNNSANRPDLLLNENLNGEYLLIEFKRPSHPLNHDDYTQAISYRHELAKHISKPIKVLVLGGRRSPDYPTSNVEPDVKGMVFLDVISTARRQVEWLLRNG